MKRRDFLRKSALIASGTVAAGLVGLRSHRVLAATTPANDFSIDVVTDQPDYAIRHIEHLIRHSPLRHHTVRFAEYQLPGSHVGDIAFIRAQQLVDFRHATDAFSQHLTDLARALSLPRRYDNPTLLRFFAEEGTTVPHAVNIFCGNVLVKRLPIGENKTGHRIEGIHGSVTLAVENRSVRITEASCAHKTCMQLGTISRPGQALVCIPAQINIAIEGRDAFGVDSLTF